MKVFEYLVAYLPEENEDGKYDKEPTIIEKDVVMFKSEKSLVMKLTKNIPDEYDEFLEDVKIIVRPF